MRFVRFWSTGLDPEKIRQLHDRYPELTREQIAIEAMQHPIYKEDFAQLGARVVEYDPGWNNPDSPIIGSGTGAFDASPDDYPQVEFPADAIEVFQALVAAAMLGDEELVGAAEHANEGGRPRGSYVETGTFWKVFRMIVEDDASAREIDKLTSARAALARSDEGWLEYVNREKAGVITAGVPKKRAAARSALDGRRLPRGFSASSHGVLLPQRKRA